MKLLALLLAACATPQNQPALAVQAPSKPAEAVAPVAPAAAPAQAAVAPDPLLQPPVTVDGKAIPEIELKRFLALGLGSKQVENAKYAIILKEELERRKSAGEDVARFVPTDADLEAEVARQKKDFLLKYPTLDFPTEVGRAFLSLELWKEGARQTILFDRLFIPDNPEQWPPLTREALLGEGGPGWFEDAMTSYQTRLKKMQDEGLSELPPDDPIWVEYLRSVVLETLAKFSEADTNPQRMPPGVLALVDGKPIMIEDIYKQIRPYLTPDIVADARKFLAMRALMEDDLGKKGVLISRTEFETVFEPGKEWNDTISRFQMLGLQVMGFPSMEAYFDHTRLTMSFKKTLEEELKSDDKISGMLAHTNAITAAAKADCEVIMTSAYDDANVRWKPEGWQQAEARAKAIKKELDGGADWGKTLELKSEFWDPPMPDTGPDKPQFGFKFKGRWGPKTRNEFLGYLNESEYRAFLDGGTITDLVFFKQKVGTVEGPTKGVRGYYITNLKSTTPPVKPLDIKTPQHRDLIVQYYVRDKFNAWAKELLAKAIADKRVTGL